MDLLNISKQWAAILQERERGLSGFLKPVSPFRVCLINNCFLLLPLFRDVAVFLILIYPSNNAFQNSKTKL